MIVDYLGPDCGWVKKVLLLLPFLSPFTLLFLPFLAQLYSEKLTGIINPSVLFKGDICRVFALILFFGAAAKIQGREKGHFTTGIWGV